MCDFAFTDGTMKENFEEILLNGCGSPVEYGGKADQFLDFILGEATDYMMEYTNGRLLTDQDNLGVFGCSLGGLFAGYAGIKKHFVNSYIVLFY